VYRSGANTGLSQQFAVVDRSGKELERLGAPEETRAYSPSLSRDGRYVAYHRAPVADIHPVWSPDGTEVVYATRPKGIYDIYRRSLGGGSRESLVLSTPASKRPLDWSKDGRFMLFLNRSDEEKTGGDIWALPLADGGKPFPVLDSEFEEAYAQLSPDVKWIAYVTDKTGRWEVFVRSFPEPGMEWQVSTDGGAQPRWRPDGNELFFIGLDGRLMAALVRHAGSEGLDIAAAAPLFTPHMGAAVQPLSLALYNVLPDGKRFLMLNVQEETVSSPLTVLLNWKGGPGPR
jgi:Tol biopolymer transport system component